MTSNCGLIVIKEIEQLIVRYNAIAEDLDKSIEVVENYDLYADQRQEWRWYLKGQQQSLRDVALELRVLLIKKQIEST
jgi:hypothetical protein